MSHLVPEVRVDKNGVAVTKHVRPDRSAMTHAARRSVPVPPVAAPAPPGDESFEDRFDRARSANSDFAIGDAANDEAGRKALADLIDASMESDEEGRQRIDLATYVVERGDALGARSMMLHHDDPSRARTRRSPRTRFVVLDVWAMATEAGVIEANRLYRPGDPDSSVFGFLIDFYAAAATSAEEMYPIRESRDDDLRELAKLHKLAPDADPVQALGFFEERGDIDAQLYLDAFEGAPAVASGVL